MATRTLRKALVAVAAATVMTTTVLTATATASADTGAPRPGHPAAQKALEAHVRTGIPGVLGQVRDAGGTWNGSAGVADRDTGRERLPEDRFRIGSITKAFTSVVLLQLEAEGRLSLDDSIEHHLPGVVHGNGNDGRGITLRQMLNHTSGLPDYLDDAFFERIGTTDWPEHRYDTFKPAGLVATAVAHPPAFEPGTDWKYSNTNYVLAGMVIEKVTGASYESEVERRIVRPLGMRATSLPGTSPRIPGPHGRAYSDLHGGPGARIWDTTELNPSWIWSAGQAISTVGDLNRFYGALLRGELLPGKQQQELLTAVPVPVKEAGEGVAYGLGLYRTTLPCGGYIWEHGGSINGSLSVAASSPDGRHTAVFNANGDWGDADLEDVVKAEFCDTAQPARH
ncbi:peptidase [Streptomyces eurocidicus]|uniref:Peptidase n=1 Tax=Streptomyces eurocidicus TaxID=66423 RepID=A0A2N8P119_STREU|nr:serine hydrolase domain-containing protein [Streptomyces eurocidicus]MBB5121867.1 D-alanyl-D-alanine carboxypeptidase [Streptomyces eurocidicus]PNE34717.1 peptidase [Streptomyces eurocidicus]